MSQVAKSTALGTHGMDRLLWNVQSSNSSDCVHFLHSTMLLGAQHCPKASRQLHKKTRESDRICISGRKNLYINCTHLPKTNEETSAEICRDMRPFQPSSLAIQHPRSTAATTLATSRGSLGTTGPSGQPSRVVCPTGWWLEIGWLNPTRSSCGSLPI